MKLIAINAGNIAFLSRSKGFFLLALRKLFTVLVGLRVVLLCPARSAPLGGRSQSRVPTCASASSSAEIALRRRGTGARGTPGVSLILLSGPQADTQTPPEIGGISGYNAREQAGVNESMTNMANICRVAACRPVSDAGAYPHAWPSAWNIARP